MSYKRVIPRDLFNEAKLLNCLGRLYIESERHDFITVEQEDGEAFDIVQDASDGSIFVNNICVKVRGYSVHAFTGMNARDKWPMYVNHGDDVIEVFNEDGHLTKEFLAIGL